MLNGKCWMFFTFYLKFLPIRLLHRPALRGQRKQDSQTQFAAGDQNTQHSALKVNVAKTQLLVLRDKVAKSQPSKLKDIQESCFFIIPPYVTSMHHIPLRSTSYLIQHWKSLDLLSIYLIKDETYWIQNNRYKYWFHQL